MLILKDPENILPVGVLPNITFNSQIVPLPEFKLVILGRNEEAVTFFTRKPPVVQLYITPTPLFMEGLRNLTLILYFRKHCYKWSIWKSHLQLFSSSIRIRSHLSAKC